MSWSTGHWGEGYLISYSRDQHRNTFAAPQGVGEFEIPRASFRQAAIETVVPFFQVAEVSTIGRDSDLA